MFRIRANDPIHATRDLPPGTTREQAVRAGERLCAALVRRYGRGAVALCAWDQGEWRQTWCGVGRTT